MSNDQAPPLPEDRPHHIADEPLPEPTSDKPRVRAPVTPTGLPVEDQIEKEWDNNKDGGLPTLLQFQGR